MVDMTARPIGQKRARGNRTHSLIWYLAPAVVIGVLAGLTVLAPNLIIPLSARGHTVTGPEDAPRAQVAIVLGARVYQNGTPSPMLADRLQTGVSLYKLGKVDKLLLSGDHGQTTYDEVNVMLEYVLARGVPEEDVFTDHAGFSTYDTMYRARDVFKVTTALVVTQKFHLARAVYTARAMGLDATGVPADIQPYGDERRFVVRDWLARVKAFFQLHVTRPGPRYLGPAIPIDGDGRATRG
jgi:SanA protein